MKVHKHQRCVFLEGIPQTYVRFTFVLPSLFLRTKVGAKSVSEGKNSEFGTEGKRKKSELSNAKTQNHKVLFEKGNGFV